MLVSLVFYTQVLKANSEKYSPKSGTEVTAHFTIKEVLGYEFQENTEETPSKTADIIDRNTSSKKLNKQSQAFPKFSDLTYTEGLEKKTQWSQPSFAKQGPANKAEALAEVAEQLNLKFIKRNYKQLKRYEKRITSELESGFNQLTELKIKMKPNVSRLSMISTIEFNESRKIEYKASQREQAIYFKVELPFTHFADALVSSSKDTFQLIPLLK